MVRVVLELQIDRGLHTGCLQGLLGLLRARLAVAIAVGGLQSIVMAGEPVRNEGVHRRVGALVHLGGEFLAVDEVRDGLAHGLGLVGVRLARLLAIRHDLEVEGEEAFLAARSLDDLDLLVLREALDVGRGHRTVGHVDLALLHGHLQVGGVREVLDLHGVVLRRGQPLVGLVLGIRQRLVHLVGGERVRAGERVVLHDGVGVGELVGAERLLVHDRAGRAGQHLLQRHIVPHLRMEHHGGVVFGIDGFDIGKQRFRSIHIFDALDAVEGELDVGRGQVMPVRELQSLLQLHGELRAIRAPRTVIRRDVRRQLRRVVVLGVQEREHLDLHGIGTVVVRTGRIEAGDLVGGADGDGVARGRAAVLHPAACGKRGEGRHGSHRSDDFLVIHDGILSLSSPSTLSRWDNVTPTFGVLC